MQVSPCARAGMPPIPLLLACALIVLLLCIPNEALGLRSPIGQPPGNLVVTVIQERKPILPERAVPIVQQRGMSDVIVPNSPIAELPHIGVAVRTPLTQPQYPPRALRNGEEGTVDLAVLVLRDGRIAKVRVVRSSGYPRLDRAAVKEVGRKWRLLPARNGDLSTDDWGRFRVVFQIEGR